MDEITLLRNACEADTQASVAKKIGYSNTVVNLVLKGNYIGDMDKVKSRIRSRLVRDNILCPVLGEITHQQCDKQQELPFSAASSERVRLFKACRNCPFRTKGK